MSSSSPFSPFADRGREGEREGATREIGTSLAFTKIGCAPEMRGGCVTLIQSVGATIFAQMKARNTLSVGGLPRIRVEKMPDI